jgi:hypothetical protein
MRKEREAKCDTKAIQMESKAKKMLSQSFVQTSPDSISSRLFHYFVYPTSNKMFFPQLPATRKMKETI